MNSLLKTISSLLGTPMRAMVKLHGDASYRTYYRASAADGSTYIVMQMPEGKQSVSEEITNMSGTHQELPFINVQRYLASLALPVPRIVREDHAAHLIILEDLGDELMFNLVDGRADGERRTWYAKALELLVTMQGKAEARNDASCVAFKRSFDATLYNWEFDHFLEYGIEARLGLTMSAEDREVFTKETRAIAEEIQKYPRGFTHRDFQSRNLLWKNERFYLIDFQDALMGPRVYDLVALLRDSYVELSADTVRHFVAAYADARGFDPIATMREFDLVTIQRKLKDAGRFVFIDRVKKNPKFLTYIPASLGYVREAFARSGAHPELYEMLKKYVPEWQ